MATAEKPAFSFAGLSIEDDQLIRGHSAPQDNPLYDAMKASYEGRKAVKGGTWIGLAKSVVVPVEQAAKIEGYARRAAEPHGARINFTSVDRTLKLEKYSVGGKEKPVLKDGKPVMKDGKPVTRLSGGTPALKTKDGKRVTGNVRVIFAVAPARDKKESSNGATPSA